jgi:glycosyltransferase involved in cell wall biosynthesis
LLVAGFRPGAGGIGRDMLNLMNGCSEAGVEVHLLLETDENPDLKLLAESIRPHVVFLGGGENGVKRARRVIAALRPDAVISNRDRVNGLIVRATSALHPRPRTLVRVGTDQRAKLRRLNPLSRWRRRRRLIAAYRLADGVIGVSDGACEGVRELLGESGPPVRRIYSPMDVEGIRARADSRPVHPWVRERRGPLLMSVGRLVGAKDQETMVRALALLPGDHRLVIFGEGNRRSRLEALARRLGVAERLDLPGHTANPFTEVARADLFVLSSVFEGFGNAVLEALMVGTPVVSTDCPSGPREILGAGRYGALVPMRQPWLLAEAILSTLRDPPPRALLDEAVTRLEIDQAIPRYLDALGLTLSASSDGSGHRRADQGDGP